MGPVPKLVQAMTWSGSGSTQMSKAWGCVDKSCGWGLSTHMALKSRRMGRKGSQRWRTVKTISSFRGKDPNTGAGTAGLHRMEQCPKEENKVRSELTGEAGARSRATETQIQCSLPCPISSLKHRRGMSQKSSDGVLRYISHELWSYWGVAGPVLSYTVCTTSRWQRLNCPRGWRNSLSHQSGSWERWLRPKRGFSIPTLRPQVLGWTVAQIQAWSVYAPQIQAESLTEESLTRMRETYTWVPF